MTVGDRLTQLRKDRYPTRVAAAREMAIPASTLQKYEDGTRQPDHNILIFLADHYGVRVEWLLGQDTRRIAGPRGELAADQDVVDIAAKIQKLPQWLREEVDRDVTRWLAMVEAKMIASGPTSFPQGDRTAPDGTAADQEE